MPDKKTVNVSVVGERTELETNPVADLRGAPGTRPPPGGPNSFIFMQFSAEKIG